MTDCPLTLLQENFPISVEMESARKRSLSVEENKIATVPSVPQWAITSSTDVVMGSPSPLVFRGCSGNLLSEEMPVWCRDCAGPRKLSLFSRPATAEPSGNVRVCVCECECIGGGAGRRLCFELVPVRTPRWGLVCLARGSRGWAQRPAAE